MVGSPGFKLVDALKGSWSFKSKSSLLQSLTPRNLINPLFFVSALFLLSMKTLAVNAHIKNFDRRVMSAALQSFLGHRDVLHLVFKACTPK